MPLVIDGTEVPIEGKESESFLTNPDLAFPESATEPRETKPINIVLHCRGGYPGEDSQIVGFWGTDTTVGADWPFEIAQERNKNDGSSASWHISIGPDGRFACHLDLSKTVGNHAGHLNEISIGIEMYVRLNDREKKALITVETLDTCVSVCNYITQAFQIQRQFPTETDFIQRFASANPSTRNKRYRRFLDNGRAGTDYIGILGHRNCSGNKNRGDPGDKIFEYLKEALYESFPADPSNGESDLAVWRRRQLEELDIPDYLANGIPNQLTSAAIRTKLGNTNGIWAGFPTLLPIPIIE